MVTQSLPVQTFVDITTSIQSGGVPGLVFGRGLLITTDDSIAAGGSGKAQLFQNISGVVSRFGSGAALTAANVWFSADPKPQGLWIGRWADTSVSTTLTGGTPADPADFIAANYSFAINGTNVTTLDLSAVSLTYAAMAALIQTGLRTIAAFTGANVTFEDGAFIITLADASAISPAYLTPAMTTATPPVQVGTNLVPLMGMGQSGGVDYKQGHDAETAVEAANEMVGLATTGPPVAIMLASDAPLSAGTPAVDTRTALAAWASAGDYMFGLRDTAAQALVTNDITSHLALAFDSNQGKVLGAFDNAGGLPEIGGLALLSAQNLNNRQSIITTHAKAVPGVLPSLITPTQYEELKRKRANVVTRVGGLSTMVGGYTSRAGYWADAVWWLLWLKNESQLAVWNAMRGSRRLTAGIITDVMTEVLEKGVRNGGIAPGGMVDQPMEDEDMMGMGMDMGTPAVGGETKADIIATTGNSEFNGQLTSGYLLWVERASERTVADRQNRIAQFKAWIVPAPAIHNVMGDIVLV